jgi:hypothetical protein
LFIEIVIAENEFIGKSLIITPSRKTISELFKLLIKEYTNKAQ